MVVDGIQFHVSQFDLANLALQRSDELIALGGGAALQHWLLSGDKAAIKSFLEQNGNTAAFLKGTILTIRQEVAQLETCVDFGQVKKLTSVGPGLSLFELMIWQRHRCNMYLVDIEQTAAHHTGYHETGAGYSNNLDARRFLEDNGVPSEQIRFSNPTKEPLDQSEVDLIISTRSMGFHYPVHDYVQYITNALRINGNLVMDRRKGISDETLDSLLKRFQCHFALDFGKFHRLVCERRF